MTRKKNNFRTWDQMVVDKLREIEPATIKQISKELGYKNPQSPWNMLKRLRREGLIYIDITNKPYRYSVKEGSVSYD